MSKRVFQVEVASTNPGDVYVVHSTEDKDEAIALCDANPEPASVTANKADENGSYGVHENAAQRALPFPVNP